MSRNIFRAAWDGAEVSPQARSDQHLLGARTPVELASACREVMARGVGKPGDRLRARVAGAVVAVLGTPLRASDSSASARPSGAERSRAKSSAAERRPE